MSTPDLMTALMVSFVRSDDPDVPTLRLTDIGWITPRDDQPVSVPQAWRIAEHITPGTGEDILVQTDKLCGTLRASDNPTDQNTLRDLLAGIEALKAEQATKLQAGR